MGKYDYLMHFNPFHDPKNGQFTSGGGSRGVLGRFGRGKRSADNGATPPKGTPEYDAAKQRALKEGNATSVLKFKGDLTIAEMQNALSRINLERSLESISAKELSKGKSKADAMFDAMDKGAKYLNSTTNLVGAVKKFNELTSNKEKTASQTLADKFLEDVNKKVKAGQDLDDKLIVDVNDYLNKLSNIERISGGRNNKK